MALSDPASILPPFSNTGYHTGNTQMGRMLWLDAAVLSAGITFIVFLVVKMVLALLVG